MGRFSVWVAWEGPGLAIVAAASLAGVAVAQAPERPPAQAAAKSDASLEALAKAERLKFEPAKVTHKPGADEIGELYPEAARRRAVKGRATVECEVGLYGRLTACVVTQEDPTGVGFGEAALKVAALYRVAPPTLGGTPVSGTKFLIPTRFQLDLETAAREVEAEAQPADPEETPAERLKRLGPLKRSDGVLWAPIGFALLTVAGVVWGLWPVRRGRRARA